MWQLTSLLTHELRLAALILCQMSGFKAEKARLLLTLGALMTGRKYLTLYIIYTLQHS